MPKFNVTISYPVIMSCTFEIDAIDRQTAGGLALLKAKAGEGAFYEENGSILNPNYSVAEIKAADETV